MHTLLEEYFSVVKYDIKLQNIGSSKDLAVRTFRKLFCRNAGVNENVVLKFSNIFCDEGWFFLFFYKFARLFKKHISGSSSVDRASAFQAEGRGFESRLPLKFFMQSLRGCMLPE